MIQREDIALAAGCITSIATLFFGHSELALPALALGGLGKAIIPAAEPAPAK